MNALPSELREAVSEFCETVGGREIAQRAAAQTSVYRAGGKSLTAIAAKADIAAYLTARMPATYAAIKSALLAIADSAPEFRPSSLLDFGCGPGTAAWAATEIWPGISSVTMVDHNPQFLDTARILSRHGSHPALRDAMLLSAPVAPAGYDLVLAGYVMAEIAQSRVPERARELWNLCRGIIVIVEPGTPDGFARVIASRQALLEQHANIAAPCPGNTDCPVHHPDWCHFAVRLPRSRDHMRAKSATVPFEDEKFSWVAAARKSVSLTSPRARIIAPVESSKAGLHFRLCGENGLTAIDIPRRDAALYRLKSRRKWGDAF